IGDALPNGVYVNSYNVVIAYTRVVGALRDSNDHVQQRVADRTQEADLAEDTRSRFLAAVSHDVLQPINAARLFASAMHDTTEQQELKRLSDRVDTSLRAAEELLDGLLDNSQINAGGLEPEISVFDGRELLLNLQEQYRPMAARRQLDIRL